MREKKVPVGRRKIDASLHEVLSRNYVLDDAEGILTIPFRFARLEDFLSTEVGKRPQLRGALQDEIEKSLQRIPPCYDIVLRVQIADSQGQSKEECEQAVADGLALGIHSYRRRIGGKTVLALVFLVVGVLTLLGMILFQSLFQGDKTTLSIVTEVLDIAAWVFIWESVTLFFIERSEDRATFRLYRKRIRRIEIHFEDKEGEESQSSIDDPLGEESIS